MRSSTLYLPCLQHSSVLKHPKIPPPFSSPSSTATAHTRVRTLRQHGRQAFFQSDARSHAASAPASPHLFPLLQSRHLADVRHIATSSSLSSASSASATHSPSSSVSTSPTSPPSTSDSPSASTSSSPSRSPTTPPPELTPTEQGVWTKLQQAFAPRTLSIEDISGGCGSMYAIEIVAPDAFDGLSPLQMQRRVNAVLSEEIAAWHGLRLVTKA